MTIRSAAKAAIIQNGQILLQHCKDNEYGLDYYELPGGGQHPQETMEDAIIRECLEETGYHVDIIRFFALSEEIITIESVKRDFPNHAHRIFHIFLCKLRDVPEEPHSEEDAHQVGMRWFPLEEISTLRLRPTNLRSKLMPLFKSGEADFIGTSILNTFDI